MGNKRPTWTAYITKSMSTQTKSYKQQSSFTVQKFNNNDFLKMTKKNTLMYYQEFMKRK